MRKRHAEVVRIDSDRSDLRILDADELQDILDANHKWILSNKKEGHPADLRNVDLKDCDLRGANLQGADLQDADLRGADLLHTIFWNANLQDTNFSDVRGLTGVQLAGANLSGATLPPAITNFDALRHLEATAGITRPLFILIMLFCLYAVATIASTTDAGLLTNSPSALLPDLNTPIPTASFYFVAPVFLFCLYIYLHLYVEGLWEDITALPSISPDGTPLYKVVFPWLLIRLMARYVVRQEANLSQHISLMRRAINGIFVILVWWLVPITLLLFWGRYLPARDWYGSSLHIALIVMAIGYGGFRLRSYGLARAMPNNPESNPFHWKYALRDSRTYQTSTALLIGVVLVGASYGSTNGCRKNDAGFDVPCTWIPRGLALIGYDPFPNFRNADVSAKPKNWNGTADGVDLIKGAKLRGRNLQYADAFEAFLAKADLHRADLRHSKFTSANLEQANLNEANLEKADVSVDANLREADLSSANLRKTNFTGATLRDAELNGANLEKARLRFVDLQGALLSDANLHKADLTSANLTGAFLSNANAQKALFMNANLQKAYLGGVDLRKAIVISANLTDANLSGADLQGAYLGGSNFRGANLQRVNFYGASFGKLPDFYIGKTTNLSDVDLRYVRGLTQRQLDDACGNDKTELPKGLTISMCPPDNKDR